MSRASRTTFRQIWWVPVVCFGLAWGLGRWSVVQGLEWKTLDLRIWYRVLFQKPPDPRIAVIIWDDTTNDFSPAFSWPPTRDVHGQLLEFMSLSKPSVIVYDVLLDATREGDGDQKMATAVQAVAHDGVKVVTAGITNSEKSDPVPPGMEGPTRPLTHVEGDISLLWGDVDAYRPFPLLRAVSRYGFADTPHEADGVQREVPLVVRVGHDIYPSLALQALITYFNVGDDQVRVRLGDAVYLKTNTRLWRIPISANGRLFLNYRYDRDEFGDDFPEYSVIGVLMAANNYYVEKKPFAPKPPPLEGRIVLLGQAVTAKADAGATPRNGLSPLVLVHANLINNVLANDYAYRVPDWAIYLTAVILGFAGLAFVADQSVFVLCGSAILGAVGYIAVALYAWTWASWWFPVTAPLVGFGSLQFIIIGRRILLEQAQKQEIKGMFSSYLAPQLVERLVKTRQLPQLGGHEEEITPYFSDIQGFSTFSEVLPPDRLVELMNEYLTACTDIVQEEGGTLDKYIGDAVVAMFGAPVELKEHAYRSCVAALRVQQRIGELRAKWKSEGDKWPEVVWRMQSRIGLNTGRCVVGNMGSRTRFNYTMMGDTVNLAARMESGAKRWGVYTMCTEDTRAACIKVGGDRIVFRPLGSIRAKGRHQGTPIFEVVGLKESLPPATSECVTAFAQGLERFLARDWAGATELFRRSAELEPNQPGKTPGVTNNPSLVYLELVAEFEASPPAPEWDGVYEMKEK